MTRSTFHSPLKVISLNSQERNHHWTRRRRNKRKTKKEQNQKQHRNEDCLSKAIQKVHSGHLVQPHRQGVVSLKQIEHHIEKPALCPECCLGGFSNDAVTQSAQKTVERLPLLKQVTFLRSKIRLLLDCSPIPKMFSLLDFISLPSTEKCSQFCEAE